MRSFQYVTSPVRLFHGPECLAQLPKELDRLGAKRAVVMCGSSIAREAGLIDLVKAAGGDRIAGICALAKAHSPVPAVKEAAGQLKALGADAVIALGGGSAIVTARGASILLAEAGELRALATSIDEKGRLSSPKLLAPKLPQLIIPTTPTTATVKAGTALFDTESKTRLALFDPKTRAQALFVHPAALASAPRDLAVSSSLNTFAMAIEGLVSRQNNPMADALLMHALRLLKIALPDAESVTARSDMMLAAMLTGQGTDHTGAGITTVLGHAIGARFGIENGVCNAIVLPHALRFNGDAAADGMSKVATALGVASSPIEAIESLLAGLRIPARLRDVGVPREASASVAASAIGDWFLKGNPRAVSSPPELQQVIDAAW
jgi:alcohol dehydrogenase class IV